MRQPRSQASTMNKHGNPQRTRASGVKKSRGTPRPRPRHSRTLPSWYYRVQNTLENGWRDVESDDFDEDLSEMEDGEDGEDDESERSYDGPDASEYYALKYVRDERKREKLQLRREREQESERERAKEDEVRAAEVALSRANKERKSIAIKQLAGQSFELFSSAHVDHLYISDLYATKRVDFFYEDGTSNGDGSGKAAMLYGSIYLDANADCNFGPFRPPQHASRKAINLLGNGQYELSFEFLGNGYLKLRVPRDFVYMMSDGRRRQATTSGVPDVFEFVGIWRDKEKEKAEQRQRMAEASRRSPSPRETWFEMNHPMGSWRQSRWQDWS